MPVDRILLVSLDNLGDLVFASSLAPPIRERFPDASLSVWCKRYTAQVAALVPGVSEVIAADPFWDKAPGHGKGRISEFLHSVSEVRKRHFDLAVLAAAPWRTTAAVAAARVPMRIGHRRRRNRAFLTHTVAPANVRAPVLSELARLLEPLGILERRPLRYCLDRAPISDMRAQLAAQLPARFAALHPFASERRRCVPLPVWFALAERLAARGQGILWVGSSKELGELRAARSDADWCFVDRDAGGSLTATAAVLSLAALFVGHDSGPLHVAGAFGVPVVGIFAPGEPLRTFPQGVGPWRMIARPSPDGISADDILGEIDALPGRD